MTCYHSSALLEDYIDGTLPAESVDEIDQHLKSCERCRQEYEAAVSLKKLLKVKPIHQPPPEYWSELSNIIIARTIDSPALPDEPHTPIDLNAERRSAFIRSLVSFAASLVILFSAILIGSNGQERFASVSEQDSPLFVLAPMDESADSEDSSLFVSRDERMHLTRGMLLMGPPGSLGRIAALTELGILTE